jgi:hypothetical protein
MLRFDDVLELKNEGTIALDATGPLDQSDEEVIGSSGGGTPSSWSRAAFDLTAL